LLNCLNLLKIFLCFGLLGFAEFHGDLELGLGPVPRLYDWRSLIVGVSRGLHSLVHDTLLRLLIGPLFKRRSESLDSTIHFQNAHFLSSLRIDVRFIVLGVLCENTSR
jgi:hypothetical protein